MVIGVSLQPLVALIAGTLILIIPRLLNYIVAIYLIVIGCWGSSLAEGRQRARDCQTPVPSFPLTPPRLPA
jgi:threonine/homoserine efflux transporter RhtA